MRSGEYAKARNVPTCPSRRCSGCTRHPRVDPDRDAGLVHPGPEGVEPGVAGGDPAVPGDGGPLLMQDDPGALGQDQVELGDGGATSTRGIIGAPKIRSR